MDQHGFDAQMARRRQLRDRNVRGLVELMERRDDLRGVHPMADHLAESLSWMV